MKIKFETISDNRGEIRKIAQNVDVLRIISKQYTRRADHYHLKSSHLCFLLVGSITYYERPVNSNIKPIRIEIKPGDYFYTGPLLEHLMIFNSYSEFDCYSFGSRNKEDYEKDLVRTNWDLEEIYKNWKD